MYVLRPRGMSLAEQMKSELGGGRKLSQTILSDFLAVLRERRETKLSLSRLVQWDAVHQ